MMSANDSNKKLKMMLLPAIVGLILSFPVTGFFYGFAECKDCGDGPSGIIARCFIGLVEAALTTISLGKPINNEAGTSSTNLRSHVLIAFFLITPLLYLIFMLTRMKRGKKKNRKPE